MSMQAFNGEPVNDAAFLSAAAWPGNDAATGQLKYSAGNLSDFKNYLGSHGWKLLGTDIDNCSFQGTAFYIRIDKLRQLTRRSAGVPGNMDCR